VSLAPAASGSQPAAEGVTHTAHCLCGRQVRGLAILTGVGIPPASGPARRAVLLEEGTALLRQSRRQYGQVLWSLPREVVALLPAWVPMAAPNTVTFSDGPRTHEQRSEAWHRAKSALGVTVGEQRRSKLEREAREALDVAVAAFNFLEDEALADASHQHAHTVGELVGQLFGCEARYRDGSFWDVCPLTLMHLRIGLSPGFTGQRLCSVCGQDLSECPHVPGLSVTVRAEDHDGRCSACSGHWPCSQHLPGTAVDVVPHGVIAAMNLHELSWVDRPRQPRARITDLELPDALLRAQLGRLPDADEPLVCHRCQRSCTGLLTSSELLHITPDQNQSAGVRTDQAASVW
jgi:hypothetical protein